MNPYIRSMRLRTIPLSLSGVVLGTFLGIQNAVPMGWNLCLCILFLLLTTISLQVLSNLSNELGDTLHGTDSDGREGIRYSLQDGEISISQIKKFIALMAILCCVFGLLMIRFSFGTLLGWVQLALILLGAAATVAAVRYTLGHKPYGYRGLGDIFVFIFFGLVSVLGAAFVLTHTLAPLNILPACAIGFFSVGVLNINNIRDMSSDAGTRVTVALRLGEKRAKIYQTILICTAWALLLCFIVISKKYFALLCLLTLPLYIKHLRGVWTHSGGRLDPFLPLLVKATFALALLCGIGCVVSFGKTPRENMEAEFASVDSLYIEGSQGRLACTIERPDKGPSPLVIICHGLTGHQNEPQLLALKDSLLSHGVATVRFDFNGHGNSDGAFSKMTVQNEIEDLDRVYSYVRGLDWVEKDRIGLAGHSQGGLVAGVYAGDKGARKIKCLILLAPAACIHSMALKGKLFGYDIGPDMPDSIKFWEGKMLGKAYADGARELDVYGRTSRYKGPVIVIQGLKDSKALQKDALLYCRYLKNIRYFGLDGISHVFPENRALPAHLAVEFTDENL